MTTLTLFRLFTPRRTELFVKIVLWSIMALTIGMAFEYAL